MEFTARAPVTSEMTLSTMESELVVVCACVNTLALECFRAWWDISDYVLERSAVKQQVLLCHHGKPVLGLKNSAKTHSLCQTPAIWFISTYNPVSSDKKAMWWELLTILTHVCVSVWCPLCLLIFLQVCVYGLQLTNLHAAVPVFSLD